MKKDFSFKSSSASVQVRRNTAQTRVKSVSEKCNNFWTIQGNWMKLHRWTQPIKTRVLGKNEYNCSFSFLVICPLIKLIMGT